MYTSKLNVNDTQVAIKKVKDCFQETLADQLKLIRVSSPLFVETASGLNDSLNGVENPIIFTPKTYQKELQIIHSLAKWKRFALNKYEIHEGVGIYSDMNAIRRDEILDATHSIYVDQWDWEIVINASQRNFSFLKEIVTKIYTSLRVTEKYINTFYGSLKQKLPNEIFFITSQELEDMYPKLNAANRELALVKDKKAIFISSIGHALKSGEPHDGRAPDYDDWNLNGDLIFYHEPLDCALEISSMGIRVNPETLVSQLEIKKISSREYTPYHQSILNDDLPLSIGGGIGQSRICMFFLEKKHIGEVQSSIWSDEELSLTKQKNIFLL